MIYLAYLKINGQIKVTLLECICYLSPVHCSRCKVANTHFVLTDGACPNSSCNRPACQVSCFRGRHVTTPVYQ